VSKVSTVLIKRKAMFAIMHARKTRSISEY